MVKADDLKKAKGIELEVEVSREGSIYALRWEAGQAAAR
jgi:hypothetical protein